MMRTHRCGDLRTEHIGEKVSVCGWVASRRDHGGVVFLDVRDAAGIVQVVVDPDAADGADPHQLRAEYVIRADGVVRHRPEGTVNPELATGEIEVAATRLEVLNQAEPSPIPLERVEADEALRHKYRYLDLRRDRMQRNMRVRAVVNDAMRRSMIDQEFVEIETPALIASTPEGARDFVVPSRLQPGSFYALPQSPQLFKQLLMVGGFDRYFQIARCLRDEDPRADRQFEFMQYDMEMSFADAEDVMAVVTEAVQAAVEAALGELRLDLGRPPVSEGGLQFVWVVDFPLFEGIDGEGRPIPAHHPFTMPHPDDLELLTTATGDELLRARSLSYDLVVNGWELGSGSVRIHSSDVQQQVFILLGITPEQARSLFGFLLDAFRCGAPPHAGFAIGIDRFTAVLAGVENIREVTAFPKTQSGADPLTGAPSPLDQGQLAELGLQVRPRPKRA